MAEPNLKLLERVEKLQDWASHLQVDTVGGGGDDGGMETERRLTAIETLMPTLMTKTDGEVLRADLHKMDASIKTWMIATIIGLFFGFAGLFFAMSNSLRPPAAPQASAPIIIQVPATAPAATAPDSAAPHK
ncbi:hypothetical protein P3T40_003434 [Paraburkholderia sp. EB58]|uniref:hypothetical protein n=1 Tax=Paraburkholderia sp. EB58 TaxID=3035125 RepID=UPI003D25DD11